MNTETTYPNFSWELAAKYLQGANSNTCISPPGVFLLLSAIAAASEGLTKEELDQVLGGNALQDVSDGEHFANVRWLNDLIAQCPVLSNDTSIQVPAKYHLLSEYHSKLEEVFGGKLNIGNASDNAVTLQNLIVFRDKWKTKFEETKAVFYEEPYMHTGYDSVYNENLGRMTIVSQETEKAKGRKIPYISQDVFGVIVNETDDFVSVAVPFSTDCHMVLSMPKNRPLGDCLGDAEYLKQALDLSDSWPKRVKLYLPSFKIKSKLDLVPILTAMGAREVFDEYDGRITKMVDERLYIESGRQETEVEVNAEGAYAKAVTTFRAVATKMGGMGGTPPLRVIKFNHPFLFAIWQSEPTPVPLFVGTFQKLTE